MINPTTNPPFQPLRVIEVEISERLPRLNAVAEATRYSGARLAVCLHREPLGMIDILFDDAGATSEQLADAIWAAFSAKVNAHLQKDGLPAIQGLPVTGITGDAACLAARERFLANDPPLVSVIICTRDRTHFLQKTVPALVNQVYPNFELLIIDNAPATSATYDYIHENYADDARVRYIREPQPGIAWARNCGLRHARGTISAYIDDDAVADSYWVTEIALGYMLADNVACVTGLAMPFELETQAQVWYEQRGGLSAGYEEHIYDLYKHRPPHNPLFPYTVSLFGAGVSMSFRTDVFRRIGGFDILSGPGKANYQAEDILAFVKVVKAGYQLVYRPRAIVYHNHRREYEAFKNQIYRNGAGLTAFLTHCAVSYPGWIFEVATLIPAALRHVQQAHDPKTRNKAYTYPAELTRLERMGMVYGPFAYLRSWLQLRGKKPDFQLPENSAPAVIK